PELAEEAVQDLTDVFRATLGDAHSQFSLETELDVARRYLHIEKLRLGERLTVEWDIGDLPLDAQLPALTLQPLLENAIYHGIEPLPEGGTIHIEGRRESGEVRLIINNPLPPAAQRTRTRGNRMALDNIRERMAFAYGGGGVLKIDENGAQFRVELSFPAAPPPDAPEGGHEDTDRR
ncbi:MAG: histidine kinase, partial [Gammaproteobacteria bacterium]|nr:histidine kinase [Gammaproteobacteria bacterium]